MLAIHTGPTAFSVVALCSETLQRRVGSIIRLRGRNLTPRVGALSRRQLEGQVLCIADETLDVPGTRSRHDPGVLAEPPEDHPGLPSDLAKRSYTCGAPGRLIGLDQQ